MDYVIFVSLWIPSKLFVLLSLSSVKRWIKGVCYSHRKIGNFIFRAFVTLMAPVCQNGDISGSCVQHFLCFMGSRYRFQKWTRAKFVVFYFVQFLWNNIWELSWAQIPIFFFGNTLFINKREQSKCVFPCEWYEISAMRRSVRESLRGQEDGDRGWKGLCGVTTEDV